MILNKDFLKDLIKIGFDGVLGLALSFIFLSVMGHHSLLIILCGAIGGMMPDALQFAYFKWRHEPLITLQKIHIWFHSPKGLNDRPFIGIFFQLIIILLLVFLLK